VGWKETEEFFF